MRLGIVHIVVLLSTALTVAQTASAQSGQPKSLRQTTSAPTFRVDVDVVTVDATVLSRKTGRAIGPLSPQHFIVYEDGVPQHITYFSQDELPLSIVLLFDLTDSVRPVLKSLADGALAALQHLKPQDEIAVMVYAASSQLLQDFTTDRALTAAAIRRASTMKSDEAAFFNEGLFQAAQLLAHSNDPRLRRAIIWLTDNVPNVPSEEVRRRYGRSVAPDRLHTEKEALAALLKAGATVCSLVRYSELSEEAMMSRNAHWADYMLQRGQFPPGDVFRYAEQTGGEVAESNARRMPEKLAAMIDSIRARYTLGFRAASPANGSFRELRLRVTDDVEQRFGRVRVMTKTGYYR